MTALEVTLLVLLAIAVLVGGFFAYMLGEVFRR